MQYVFGLVRRVLTKHNQIQLAWHVGVRSIKREVEVPEKVWVAMFPFTFC